MKSAQIKFRMVLNRPIALLTLVALPLLLGLGFWQLERADYKRSLEAGFVVQQGRAPVELSVANIDQLPVYQRVIARGRFDNEHTWLLDNKQRRGRVGYEVISPFVLHDGAVILLNRGWLAGSGERAQLPAVEPVPGEQTIFAELAQVSEHPLLDASADRQAWPRVVLALDPGAMAEQSGHSLAGHYLKLDDSSPGAFETDWQPVTMSAQKHSGYALQWFALALALVVWFVYANSNLASYWRSRRQLKQARKQQH